MRVLIATYAEHSSLLGMVPLGWALRNAGHEVRVASQPALSDEIAQTGLTAVSVGKNHEFDSIESWAAEGDPDDEGFDLSEDRPEVMTAENLGWFHDESVRWWWKVINDPMLQDLVSFARQWKPDLVLWEPTTFAAPLAARACGAAHGRILWSLDLLARLRARFVDALEQLPEQERVDPMAAWLGQRAHTAGTDFHEELTRGQFTLDPFPPSLRLDPVPGVDHLPLRYIPYNGRAIVPSWLREPPTRPRVCVTTGMTDPDRMGGTPLPVDDVLEAVADIDAEIVVTLDEKDGKRLGPVPDNVRFVGFTPLHVLLPTCDAIVHHGGGGTLLSAVVAGIPQLVVAHPQMYDAEQLGTRVMEQGAGTVLDVRDADPHLIGVHLRELLEEEAFTEGARSLRGELTRMPTPGDLAIELERRVAEHRAGHAEQAS